MNQFQNLLVSYNPVTIPRLSKRFLYNWSRKDFATPSRIGSVVQSGEILPSNLANTCTLRLPPCPLSISCPRMSTTPDSTYSNGVQEDGNSSVSAQLSTHPSRQGLLLVAHMDPNHKAVSHARPEFWQTSMGCSSNRACKRRPNVQSNRTTLSAPPGCWRAP